MTNREPLLQHFNKESRRGKWEAFGYSPKLGKRVRIESPWRDELVFDDLGNMQDGDECFTNVLFYQVADRETN